jgi:hypothetical protein
MSMYYDGSGRMRERNRGLLHGLRATGVALKMIAFIGFVASYPVWGRFVPNRAI